MTARMFDYPATPNERAVTRRNNERHQLGLFQLEQPEALPACPVCAGTHTEADCTHGTALTFPIGRHGSVTVAGTGPVIAEQPTPELIAERAEATRNPSNPAQVRAMFRSLGWPTTES